MNKPSHKSLLFGKIFRIVGFFWLIILILHKDTDNRQKTINLKMYENCNQGKCNQGIYDQRKCYQRKFYQRNVIKENIIKENIIKENEDNVWLIDERGFRKNYSMSADEKDISLINPKHLPRLADSAEDKLMIFFLFSQKTGSDTSCKLSPLNMEIFKITFREQGNMANYFQGIRELGTPLDGPHWWYFSYFSKRTEFDTSCKLSPFGDKIWKIFQNVICWNFYPALKML